MPEHDCLLLELSATEFVTHMVEMAGLPRTAPGERTADVLRHVYEERYRPIGGYSTGMKQRVKLAQALVHYRSCCSTSRRTASTRRADEMLSSCAASGTNSESRPSSPATSSATSSASAPSCWRSTPAGSALRTHRGFTERTGVLSVEVEEVPRRSAGRRPHRWGPTAHLDGRTVLVEAHDERPYDLVRDRIVDLGLALVRLEQRRGSLEDLFSDEATDAA